MREGVYSLVPRSSRVVRDGFEVGDQEEEGVGGWHSPDTVSSGGSSTASVVTCTGSRAPVLLECSSR